MFLNDNNVVMNGTEIIFLNGIARQEYMELVSKIMGNMLDDLSKITGLEKEEIMEDYISLHEYSPFDEILKREGKLPKDERKSLVLSVMMNVIREKNR